MKYRFILFFYVIGMSLHGQVMQGGIGLGKSVYWGDLNAPEFGSNLSHNGGLAIQAYFKKNYGNRYGLKYNLLYGKLQGNDIFSSQQWQVERNLSFKTHIIEASVLGEYYLFGFDPISNEKPFSPYFTAGLGVLYFNPKADYLGVTYDLQSLGTEGQGNSGFGSKYNKVALAIPFGGGAIIKLTNAINLSIDIVGRRAFTDFIDDVSGYYVNYNELAALNGEISAKLADRTNEYLGINEPKLRQTGDQRGGKFVSDWYFTAMMGINFVIGDTDKLSRRKSNYRSSCPKF